MRPLAPIRTAHRGRAGEASLIGGTGRSASRPRESPSRAARAARRAPCSDSSSCRSSSRCSVDRCTGVSTTTRQNRSPRAPPRTGFTPLSRRRNTRPDWVSAGILSDTSPSSVGTSTVPPSAAVAKLIGTSQLRCSPRARRSRARAPAPRRTGPRADRRCVPPRPRPTSRTRSPVSTPAGIFTDSFLARRTRPCPRQVSQGLRTMVPMPRQRGQVCCS